MHDPELPPLFEESALPSVGSLWSFHGAIWRVAQSDRAHIFLEDLRTRALARIHPSRWPGPYRDAMTPTVDSVWENVPDDGTVRFSARVVAEDRRAVKLTRLDTARTLIVPKPEWPGLFLPLRSPLPRATQKRAILVGGFTGQPLERMSEAAFEIGVAVHYQIPMHNKTSGRWTFPGGLDLMIVVTDEAGPKLLGEAVAKAGRSLPLVYVRSTDFQDDLWRGLQNHWPDTYFPATLFGGVDGAEDDVPLEAKAPVPADLPDVWTLDGDIWVLGDELDADTAPTAGGSGVAGGAGGSRGGDGAVAALAAAGAFLFAAAAGKARGKVRRKAR